MRHVLFVCSHNAGREIRMAADAALAAFQEVPVRSFVMTIANRKAREVLRSGAEPAIA